MKGCDVALSFVDWGVLCVWDPSGGGENAYWTGPQENPMNAAEGSSCIADFAGVGGFCRSADTLIDELAASGDDWKSVENAKP